MAQTSGFDSTLKVKTCQNKEDGPRGTPSQETLSVASQGALEISSVIGDPPSLISDHFPHLKWWQNPVNVTKVVDLHPKDHNIQIFTDASNEGWGSHLEQVSVKGLWSDRVKRLHINVLESKVTSLALKVSRTSVKIGCCRQLKSSGLQKQTRRNPLSGDVCSPVEKVQGPVSKSNSIGLTTIMDR